MNPKLLKLLIVALCAALAIVSENSAAGRSPRCRSILNAHRQACEPLDTIYVGASATGRVLDLLRQDFNIVSLRDRMPSPFFFGPVVVGTADLADPAVAKLLIEVYAAGRTVALTAATVEEANRFSRFFGVSEFASCKAQKDDSGIVLYGLQQSVARRPALRSSYCLNGIGNPDRRRDRSTREWLSARFALSPPEPPPGAAEDSSVNLQDLASQTHCSYRDTNDPDQLGRQLQLDSYVLSVRSFDNDQDLYLINNELQFQPGSFQGPTYEFEIQRFGATGVQNIDAMIDFTEPASQTVSVSYTNSESTSVSGSVGFNESQGVNASVGASVNRR